MQAVPRAGLGDIWQARRVNEATDHTARLTTYTIDQLHFDPLNPRVPELVDGTNEEQVLRWMLSDASLLDLMGSIAEHGYFPGEPLLLAPRDGGGYTVVEETGGWQLCDCFCIRTRRQCARRRCNS